MPPEDWRDERRQPFEGSMGWAAQVAVGLIVTAFGVVGLAVVPTAELDCTRDAPSEPGCEMRWKIFFDGVTVRHVTIDELRGVEVETLDDSANERDSAAVPNHQLKLATESGIVTMNLLGEWQPIQQAREEVASFLANREEQELRVTLGPTGGFIWIRRGGTLIALLGLGAVVAVPLRLARRFSRGE